MASAQRKWAPRKRDCVRLHNSLIRIVASVAATMSCIHDEVIETVKGRATAENS